MNTTAKIFIIINLLAALGVAYVSLVSYATSENWKRRWDYDTRTAKDEKEPLIQKVVEESIEKNRAQQAAKATLVTLANRETVIAGKTSELNMANSKLIEETKEKENARNETLSLQKYVSSLNNTLAVERTRVQQLNTIASVAQAVAYELGTKQGELEDDNNHLTLENTRLRETIARNENEMVRDRAKLAIVRDQHPDVWKQINSSDPQPTVAPGMIATIKAGENGKQELVTVTIGSKDGVKRGMEFTVYRKGSYICKVRAMKVLDAMTACEVVLESWNTQNLTIEQGDTVTNRIW